MQTPVGKKPDGTAAARRDVLNHLLSDRPAPRLIEEKDKARARFVTLLERIGLLQRQPPKLLTPEHHSHPSTAAAWQVTMEYWEQVRTGAQPLSGLVDKLRAAPFGMGARVIPLVFAAALRDHIRGISLHLERNTGKQGWQRQEVDGETLDLAFRDPHSYQVRWRPPVPTPIEGLLWALEGPDAIPARPQLLDRTRDAVAVWFRKLPRHCHSTEDLGKEARVLRDRVRAERARGLRESGLLQLGSGVARLEEECRALQDYLAQRAQSSQRPRSRPQKRPPESARRIRSAACRSLTSYRRRSEP